MLNKLIESVFDALFAGRLNRFSRQIVGTGFAVVASAAVAVVLWWFVAGRDGLLSWYAAASIVGVVLGALLIARLWNGRTLPRVAVAKFSSAGEKDAAEAEASALQDIIKSELTATADEIPEGARLMVKTLPQVIDPREDAALALRSARGARSSVVVCGHVNVIGGRSDYAVRILIPRGRLQQPGARHQAKLLGATPEQLDLSRTSLAEQSAATARVALGIALLNERKVALARQVLVGRLDGSDDAVPGDTDPAVLFFGAFAAYLENDYQAALRYAAVSWRADQWAPAAALAAASAFEAGHGEQGRTFLSVIESSRPAESGWGEWIDKLMMLSYGLGLTDILLQMNEKLDESTKRVREAWQKLEAAQSRRVTISTLALLRDGEYEAVLADLEPVAPGTGSQKLALAALAQLRLGRATAAARTAAMAAAEASQDPKEAGSTAGWLAEVFAHLEDPDQAAHWWDLELRHEHDASPDLWNREAALIVARIHLQPVWDSEPVQRVRDRWSAVSSSSSDVDGSPARDAPPSDRG